MSLAALYDGWWTQARAAFVRGEAKLDSHLAGPLPDRRRGMTLAIKPDAATAARLAAALAPLREIEPDQYFYRPEELHVSFLSLFSGSPDYRRPAPWEPYRAAAREALQGAPPFGIALRGLTATAEAALIQGFPEDDALNRARDRFRERFSAAGLGGTLDARYRMTSSHLTAMRFRRPLRDGGALAARIGALRDLSLGRIEVREVELVETDWYHSAGKVEVLDTIPLR